MIPKDLTPLLLPTTLQGQRVVALDCAALLGPGGPLSDASVVQGRIADLDAAFLAKHQPGLLILPLFASAYDVMAVIELLQDLGYAGRIAVLAPSLPKPRLVEAELRAIGPGDRLSLISP